MLQNERYNQIYDLVKERGTVTVHYLQNQLHASEATIRRDLKAMEDRGLIKRIWGGAMLPTVEKDIPPIVRMRLNNEKKEKIASIAANLITSGTTMFIDSSTTCLALVPCLAALKNVTVVTNNLKLSKMLEEQTSVSTILVGGQIHDGYILTGYAAIQAVKMYHTDILFFSCSNISVAGITSIDAKVAAVCREMLRHADKKVLLCDTSKVGKASLLRVAELDDPDYVIMDSVPDDTALVNALGDRLITRPEQLLTR